MISEYSYDKRAEQLTKSWLMGVRRGWLSLMKPRIRDWSDVIKAIDALHKFVNNLKEQVKFVRRSRLPMDGSDQLSRKFNGLLSQIESQRSKAKHWMQVHTRTTGMPSGTFTVEEGEKMFNLYRDKFDEVMTYWKGRERPLTDLLDKILAILRKEAAQQKEILDKPEQWPGAKERLESSFREFSYGRMKVIVQDMKAEGSLINKYVKQIDKAYQLLGRSGFQKLWYGVMFIESIDYEKLDARETVAYEAMGYKNLRNRAGRYHTGEDIFVLTQPPTSWVAESIVHELGHRYWYKFMNGAQRARFEDLVKVNPSPEDSKNAPQPIPQRVISDLQNRVHEARQRVDKGMERVKLDDRFYNPRGIWQVFDEVNSQLNGGLRVLKILVLDPVELRAYVKPEEDPWIRKTLSRAEAQMKRLEERIRSLNAFVSQFSGEAGTDPERFRRRFDMWKKDWLMDMDATLMGVEGLAYEVVQAFDTAQRDLIKRLEKEDPRVILPVSEYGKSHIREAFAEAFTWYVYGRDMSRDQIESFKSVIKHAGENFFNDTVINVADQFLSESVVERYLNDRN